MKKSSFKIVFIVLLGVLLSGCCKQVAPEVMRANNLAHTYNGCVQGQLLRDFGKDLSFQAGFGPIDTQNPSSDWGVGGLEISRKTNKKGREALRRAKIVCEPYKTQQFVPPLGYED